MRPRGFTLIELMVVVAIIGVLTLLVAPSFQDMILMQRLRGVNAQVVTDMQFARADAVNRNRDMRVNLGSDADQTCYVLYTAPSNGVRCDCTRGATQACVAGSGAVEVKTVSVPRSSKVALAWEMADSAFAFDRTTGSLMAIQTDMPPDPPPNVAVDARIDDDRRLRTKLANTGRPSVCAPNAARMQVTAC